VLEPFRIAMTGKERIPIEKSQVNLFVLNLEERIVHNENRYQKSIAEQARKETTQPREDARASATVSKCFLAPQTVNPNHRSC